MPLRKPTSYVAILALVLFAGLQVLHFHPLTESNPTSTSHCSLCLVSHSTATLVVCVVQPIILASAIAEISWEAQPQSRLHVEPAFIRPPPATV